MNLEAQSAPVSLVPQLDIPHHASEDLVPTPVDNAPPALDFEAPVDNAPSAVEPASPARPSLLTRLFGSSGTRQQQERHITERRRGFISDTVPSTPSEEQRLLQVQINTEAAEQMMVISRMETEIAKLCARKAAAETALAQSHQQTRESEQASTGNLGASPSLSPLRERRSPRRSPSPPAEVAALLQLFQLQQQQTADQRREDDRRREDQEQRREDRREEQRREDRREAAEREERLENRIAEREARLEARLLQTPSFATVGPASTSGFKSNKAFDTLPLFSGDNNQSFRAWHEEFMSKAGIVGVHHDNLRELRLKLTGPARAHYYGRYTDNDEPALLAAMAHLSSEFGAKYGEAKLWAGVYQFKRKPGCPGKDVTRALAADRQKMLAAGIPAARSEAEDMYYLHELSLTAAQLAVFLAQLSGRADVSDAHLQRLMGAPDGARRESFLPALTSSDERTALFETRLELIVAFLDHDPGSPGHGGTARVAATSGTPDDTPCPVPPARPPPPSTSCTPPANREAVVLALEADRAARWARAGPAPRYYGPRQGDNSAFLTRNAAVFTERQANRECFGCTPEQLAAQGHIPHWECKHHGQDASETDRALRVPGSGREVLGPRTNRRP